MIQAFAEDMVASGGLGLTIGSDLFCGWWPEGETADPMSVVLESVGARAEPTCLTSREVQLQILTRGSTYFVARAEAHRIYEWMITRRGEALAGWAVLTVLGNAGPQSLGQDELGRWEFSANYTVLARKG